MDEPTEDAIFEAQAALSSLLGYQLRRATAVMLGDLAERLGGLGATPAHYSAMTVIRAAPGINQSAVGRLIGIQRANMVALVADLATKGWVRRQSPDGRGRSYALSLTAEGEAAIHRLREAVNANEALFKARLVDPDGTGLELGRLWGDDFPDR